MGAYLEAALLELVLKGEAAILTEVVERALGERRSSLGELRNKSQQGNAQRGKDDKKSEHHRLS